MLATAACCPMMVTYRPPEPVGPQRDDPTQPRARDGRVVTTDERPTSISYLMTGMTVPLILYGVATPRAATGISLSQ